MNLNSFRYCSSAVLCVLLCACSTVSSVTSAISSPSGDRVALPEEELRALAREIEKAVSEENTEPIIPSSEVLTIDDPRILQSIRTRSLRFPLLNEFRGRRHSWERRNGRLWIIKSSAYRDNSTSQQRNRDAFLVYSENEDRWRLYETLIETNNLRGDSLSAIEEIFFEARLEFMERGQLFENNEGDPVGVREVLPAG